MEKVASTTTTPECLEDYSKSEEEEFVHLTDER